MPQFNLRFRGMIFLFFLVHMACSSVAQEKLIYHNIQTDPAGNIIPWSHKESGKAWSHVIDLVWNFWDTMRTDMNGIPYYMNHQVWKPDVNDARGIGGDQINMALSSWRLLYAYTGNERIRENMRFMADYYLTNGLSPSDAQWPDLPYPYNTLTYSGKYDGDMVIGKGYTQPDKAGSFGAELVNLYKMFSGERFPNKTYNLYLNAAISIANTLAKHTLPGDEKKSPLPFKVNAITNEIGTLKAGEGSKAESILSNYTSNWSGTLELFLELNKLGVGDTAAYSKAFDVILRWMKTYPLKNDRWGPFFEDIPGWSDTQINAITFAQFMMNHPELFPNWKKEVRGIFDWVNNTLGNDEWKKYGVTVINEQTAYRVPGNSHTAREAATELRYMAVTGDRYHFENAIRQLNWATYMVAEDGRNQYPRDDIWLTDGYGDYVRHYLGAMAAFPELAPAAEDHLLSTTGLIQQIEYPGQQNFLTFDRTKNDSVRIAYRSFEPTGTELLRMKRKPRLILMEKTVLNAIESTRVDAQGFYWQSLPGGEGILTIKRKKGNRILISD